jgi:uncharacterized protein YbaA (DUF1428 family)
MWSGARRGRRSSARSPLKWPILPRRPKPKEQTMAYVDGFVIPVPKGNRNEYHNVAAIAAPIFKEHGALKVVECWGDDIPKGEHTDFYGAVKCTEDETVVFSWIVWPDKATRDEGNKKVMADPRLNPESTPMPFDGKRMIFGGFEVLLEA